MAIRRRVVVSGRVQGVGFRAAVSRHARTRGVAGWVRNLPSGEVEAVFEGDEPAVAGMVRYCGEGPSGAVVAEIEVVEEPPVGETGFSA
jgi:acylphosphatase